MQMEAVVARSSSPEQINQEAGLTQSPGTSELRDEQIAQIRDVDAERKALATLNEITEPKKPFDLAQLKTEHSAGGINETAAEHVRLLRERAGVNGDAPESVEKAAALVMHHARAARNQDEAQANSDEASLKPERKKDDDLARPFEPSALKRQPDLEAIKKPSDIGQATDNGAAPEKPESAAKSLKESKLGEDLVAKPALRAVPLDPALEESLRGALEEVGSRWQQALKNGPENTNSLAA